MSLWTFLFGDNNATVQVTVPPGTKPGTQGAIPALTYRGVEAILANNFKRDGNVTSAGMAVILGQPVNPTDTGSLKLVTKAALDAAFLSGDVDEDVYTIITSQVPPLATFQKYDQSAWLEVPEIATQAASTTIKQALASYTIKDVPNGYSPQVQVHIRPKPDAVLSALPAVRALISGAYDAAQTTVSSKTNNRRDWAIAPILILDTDAAATTVAIPTGQYQYRVSWSITKD